MFRTSREVGVGTCSDLTEVYEMIARLANVKFEGQGRVEWNAYLCQLNIGCYAYCPYDRNIWHSSISHSTKFRLSGVHSCSSGWWTSIWNGRLMPLRCGVSDKYSASALEIMFPTTMYVLSLAVLQFRRWCKDTSACLATSPDLTQCWTTTVLYVQWSRYLLIHPGEDNAKGRLRLTWTCI